MFEFEDIDLETSYPNCNKCSKSVEGGGYPGTATGVLYCEDCKERYTDKVFVSLIIDEDENFVV